MKLVGVREVQLRLRELVARAQKECVVITRHGRAVAAVIGIDGMSMEDVVNKYANKVRR